MEPIRAVFAIGGMYGGGSERQMVSLLRDIDRDQFRLHLYLFQASGPLLCEIPDDVLVTSYDQRHSGSEFPRILNHRRRVNDMARYLDEVRAQVVYDRTFLMTMVSATAAQTKRIPNVSTIVTDPTRGFAPVAGRFQPVKRRLLRRCYLGSTRVLANSEGSARAAERFYGLPTGLVDVLGNALDIERISRQAETTIASTWWNDTGESEKVFRIACAGRLNHEKGFHLLIDAIAQVVKDLSDRTIRVAILGEGDGRPRLENQIQSLNLQDTVQLVGFQSNAPAWFKSADLFVLPSLLEGLPNVLLEAMACGTSVLAADCPSGPREILMDGEMGELCQVDSTDALVSGIRKALVESDQWQARAEKAMNHVYDTYASDVVVPRLEQILVDAAHAR